MQNKIDWQNFFKAEDFKEAKPIGMSEVGCIQAADIANKLLRNAIESAPVVQGRRIVSTTWLWSEKNDELVDCTHKARLISVTEIKDGE